MASEQLRVIIEQLRARPVADEDQTFTQSRADFEQMGALFPIAADVRREQASVGSVPSELLSMPESAADRVVLYLHGGGYVIGSSNTYRDMASRIGRAAQARVLLIDYRLAPEHPFPAAVLDAVEAYRWLLNEGYSPGRIAVAGDSAGGGLTVATLVALRYLGLPRPAAGICLSPWVDLECIGETMTSRSATDPVVQRQGLSKMAQAYLNGADPGTPLAAPLYADLRGLPPLLIQVGSAETLLSDSTRLAENARAVGVPVTLEIWDEMIHVWQLFSAQLPEAQQAIEGIGAFIRARIPDAAPQREPALSV